MQIFASERAERVSVAKRCESIQALTDAIEDVAGL